MNYVKIKDCFERHEDLTEQINKLEKNTVARFNKLENKINILIVIIAILALATIPQIIKLLAPMALAFGG